MENPWGNIKNTRKNIPTDKGYIEIYSNEFAFTAVKPDGSIRTWGLDQPATKRLVHLWYWLCYYLRIHHQCCHLKQGRYVRIQLLDKNYLSLAEVQVMGVDL
jgi:hypothetical protein